MDDLLLGPEAATAALLAALEARVPGVVAAMDDRYGRPVPLPEGGELDLWRPPALYTGTDRAILAPEDYPAVLTILQRTEAAMVVEPAEGGQEWRIPYVFRVWLMVRHSGHDEVLAARNRLANAIVHALLLHPELGPAHTLEQAGWRSSYSDVAVDEEDAGTFAGWFGDFTVLADELASPAALGVVDTIAVTVAPTHPALA